MRRGGELGLTRKGTSNRRRDTIPAKKVPKLTPGKGLREKVG